MVAELLVDVRTHLELAGSALAAGIVVAVPLGVAAAASSVLRGPIVALATLGRTVPSLAVLAFILPVLGVGFAPALVALTLLAIPPIAINTDVGLRETPPEALDAALGMGMTRGQTFMRIAWPHALPAIFAGVRTAAIEVIASATLATFIGAGGLGDPIVRGLQTGDDRALYAGALTVAALALAVEFLGGAVARRRGLSA